MDAESGAQLGIAVAAAVIVAGVVVNRLLSSHPKLPKVAKPFGVVDKEGVLWDSTSVGKFEAPTGGSTVYELIKNACQRFSKNPGFGKRPLLERHYDAHDGKEVEKLTFADDYEWMSYGDYGEALHALGSGMVRLASLKPGDCIVIYAETQLEWMLAAQAAWSQGLTVVTVYATLGEEGFAHGVKQTKAKLVVADAKLLPKVASAARKATSGLGKCTHVISITDNVRKPDPKAAAIAQVSHADLSKLGWTITLFEEALAKGKVGTLPPSPPAADDTAMIMYTSGTTGMPKGVILTHANIVSAACGFLLRMDTFGAFSDGDASVHTYLAYLPLAHIMEVVIEVSMLSVGVKCGYGSPHTLTPTGVKIKQGTCVGDAQALKPTVLAFAPAVLDKVYANLSAKIAASSKLIQKLFARGVEDGEANFKSGLIGAHWFYNKLVFKKVQALLGGRLVFAGTGSAPLSPKVQAFVQTCFNAPCRQGYGLTETAAVTCVQIGSDNTTSVVGPPVSTSCIKLRDWPEGNYLNADLYNPEIGMRRGEVLIGGPNVCKGYLVDPDAPDADVIKKNEEDFSVDANGVRWFHTGDIGQITPDGNLSIIDRKKDLVKLQQGEYVALSKVENALKACPLVEVPMCYARSTESYCVALVCPVAPALKALAAELGITGESIEQLCDEPKLVAEVTRRCQAACKGKLVAFETPKKIGLVAETWTPENDLLTAAMKLKRVPIIKKHKEQLDALYK